MKTIFAMLILFLMIPMNFGTVSDSTSDDLADHLVEVEQNTISYEVSDLISYLEYEQIPVYHPTADEALYMMPHVSAMLYRIELEQSQYNLQTHMTNDANSNYNNNANPGKLSNNNNLYDNRYDNIINESHIINIAINNNTDKGEGIFPFSSRYTIPNSKVNKQILFHYTSGFL